MKTTPLSWPMTVTLDVLRSLGQARTRELAAALPDQLSLAATTKRLEQLEKLGLVTSSLTLDGLERIWTVDKAGAK